MIVKHNVINVMIVEVSTFPVQDDLMEIVLVL
jgi:hypothetical protein